MVYRKLLDFEDVMEGDQVKYWDLKTAQEYWMNCKNGFYRLKSAEYRRPAIMEIFEANIIDA